MGNANIFNDGEFTISVEKCQTYIIRTHYSNVIEIAQAASNYGQDFPNPTYWVICKGITGIYWFQFYAGFEGYDAMYHQFDVYEELRPDEVEMFAVNMIVANLDNMNWDEAIDMYVQEAGIDYMEEGEQLMD